MRDILKKVLGDKTYIPFKYFIKKILCFCKGVQDTGSNVFLSPQVVVKRGRRIHLKDNVVVERDVILWVDTEKSSISIGENSYLSSHCILNTFDGWIKLGKNCSLNNYAILYGHGGLEIGDNVRIAAQAVIIPMNHIFDNPDIPICEQGIDARGIKIEDDVWIGAGAKITDGVTIGKGSVIGTGAVVTKSIPPFSIAVGVPAKVIRKRGDN